MTPRWEPAQEAHAIVIASAAAVFSESLTEPVWKRVLRIAERMAPTADLPNVVAANQLQFLVGPTPQVMKGPIGSIQFQRMDIISKPDGSIENHVAEELIIGRDNAVYRTTVYTRWASFHEKLIVLLKPALEEVLTGTDIAHVRLEYRDQFRYSGDPNSAAAGDLLREGSPLIAPHVFTRTDLWHSHTGMFVPSSGAKRLIQVAIDATDFANPDGSTQRKVDIMTAVQDNFIPSMGATDEIEGIGDHVSTAAAIVGKFDDLHGTSKQVFADLIREEVARRIGLRAEASNT